MDGEHSSANFNMIFGVFVPFLVLVLGVVEAVGGLELKVLVLDGLELLPDGFGFFLADEPALDPDSLLRDALPTGVANFFAPDPEVLLLTISI